MVDLVNLADLHGKYARSVICIDVDLDVIDLPHTVCCRSITLKTVHLNGIQ